MQPFGIEDEHDFLLVPTYYELIRRYRCPVKRTLPFQILRCDNQRCSVAYLLAALLRKTTLMSDSVCLKTIPSLDNGCLWNADVSSILIPITSLSMSFLTGQELRSLIGVCPQQNIAVNMLTVREQVR